MFTTRAYNSFEINKKTKASIIKTSDEDRLLGEMNYYKNLPDELKIYFPRLLKYKATPRYSMELEYYAYDNLGNSMISLEYNDQYWDNVFSFLLRYIDSYINSKSIKSQSNDSKAMFIEKTENEYNSLVNNFDYFNKISHYDEFFLNGKKLKSFKKIWTKLKHLIIDKINNDSFYFIHGDLCFSNILCGTNPITKDIILKMIDPRGVFGTTDFFGDPYYDLAKISHSCSGGYEFFIYDRFEINTHDNNFDLKFIDNQNMEKINSKFINIVDQYKFDYEKIRLLEGSIFIGMCARHYDSLDRQKAMFITGLNILNDIYEKI
jgi:hypothetical protein